MTISVKIAHIGGDKILEVVQNTTHGTVNRLKQGEDITLAVYDTNEITLREAAADVREEVSE